ncbi:MAG: hypothetical protein FJW96_16535 [Actinobacteria bacterium]|nr:hypothetical protein [Actinomycetota bacterium]
MLSGDVLAFVDSSFFDLEPYDGVGRVGATGPRYRVDRGFTSGTYEIDGVDEGTPLWLDVVPDDASGDEMPTLLLTQPGALLVDLKVARRSVVNSLLELLDDRRSVDAAEGSLFVAFVDSSGAPVSGVEVTRHPGAAVAYDDGPGMNQVVGSTQARGMALIAGIPAGAVPGAFVAIDYTSTAGGNKTVAVRVAGGAVTYVTALP